MRRPAALVLGALALAVAPAPAFASAPADAPVPAPVPAPARDFGAAATCLQEVAVVPALGSHAAGPTRCSGGTALDHVAGTVGSLTR
ncbi:hypothetical protein ACFVUH_26615 [Kitasatospora sp. NPDC058032]|uniref:hypothetical protein n=1 Tax=Kitasatospora sp. NPDC058032 TaxID=3346307 RepID=UPI0036DA4774